LYFQDKITENKENTAQLWKTINKISVLLNTAKNTREQGITKDPFAIRVRVRAAYLSSVIAIMSLEAK